MTPTLFRSALALALCTTASLAHAEGQATFYNRPNFGGVDLTVSDPLPQLSISGSVPESVLVRSGRWEICSRDNFRGRCTILEVGEYPRIGEQFGYIASAREVASIPEEELKYRRHVQPDRRPWR